MYIYIYIIDTLLYVIGYSAWFDLFWRSFEVKSTKNTKKSLKNY